MSYSTGSLPKPTTDSFSAPAAVVLHCYGAISALLIVTNQAVVVQISEPGHRPDSADTWQDEFYAPPGAYPLDSGENESIDAIRVRSATAGKPANVSIVAFP